MPVVDIRRYTSTMALLQYDSYCPGFCYFCIVKAHAYNVNTTMQLCEVFREQLLAFEVNAR